jgi:hypothetical protein
LKKFNILYFAYRYKKEEEYTQNDLIAPIISWQKDLNYKYFRFVPFIFYKKSQQSNYFTVLPLYYQEISAESSNYNFLMILFQFHHLHNISKSYNFLWKTFFIKNYESGDFETRFLYLVYANVRKDGETVKSLFPIYYMTKDDDGNKSLSLFFYFYNNFKRKIPDQNVFYQEERIFWIIRLRSNYRQLKKQGLIE